MERLGEIRRPWDFNETSATWVTRCLLASGLVDFAAAAIRAIVDRNRLILIAECKE
jgi:hypothetical protein